MARPASECYEVISECPLEETDSENEDDDLSSWLSDSERWVIWWKAYLFEVPVAFTEKFFSSFFERNFRADFGDRVFDELYEVFHWHWEQPTYAQITATEKGLRISP